MICSEVPNIAALCRAEEKRELLSVSPSKSIIKKVGVGLTRTLSETETIEYRFYSNFELEIEYTLSTNFKDHIGKSSQTNYDWRSAPKSTWQTEQNVTIDIETSSECETEFYEVIGKCSYFNIRPYHLERVDNCRNSSFKTTEIIPHNIRKRSYKSEIPEAIKNKFK